MESPFDDDAADWTKDGGGGPGWAWQAAAAAAGVFSAAMTRRLLTQGRKRLLQDRAADTPKKGRTTVLWTATMAVGGVLGRALSQRALTALWRRRHARPTAR